MKRAAIAVFVLMCSCLAYSQVYRWKDKNGNTVVSTTPPPPGVEAEKRDTEPVDPVSGPKPAVWKPTDSDLQRPLKDIKVVMYVTEWCTYCRKARAFLQSLGITPVEYDIEKEPSRGKECREKAGGRTGIPVIDVEGRIEYGFNPTRLRAALEEKQRVVRY